MELINRDLIYALAVQHFGPKLGTAACRFNSMIDDESAEDLLDVKVFDNGRSPATLSINLVR